MVLRKQTAYSGMWSTRLDFEPSNDFEEAGTVVFYSDVSYAAILIKSVNGSRVIVARWTDHETRTIKASLIRFIFTLSLTASGEDVCSATYRASRPVHTSRTYSLHFVIRGCRRRNNSGCHRSLFHGTRWRFPGRIRILLYRRTLWAIQSDGRWREWTLSCALHLGFVRRTRHGSRSQGLGSTGQ